jgi:hypothetical protein
MEKIKENWLTIIFVILLIIFIVLRLSLFLNSSKTSDRSSNTVTPIISPTSENSDYEDAVYNEYGGDLTEDMENSVVQYDIEEYVPYETDDFKIIDLTDNKLIVSAKNDKDKAAERLNDFLEKEVTEDSQTFEIVWQ